MTVDVGKSEKVMKLKDSTLDGGAAEKASDMLTLAHLWQLLSGGHALKDGTVFERRVL